MIGAWRGRVLVAAIAAVAMLPGTAAHAATPRTSLSDVEDGVMCPSCREPLALAQSPQAIAERGYIEQLIANGLDKQQIESALVGQYGPAVLAKPPASGFNLTVYILPPALLLAGLVTLAVLLPRWRRRTRAAAAGEDAGGASATGSGLSAADTARLEADLARFDG